MGVEVKLIKTFLQVFVGFIVLISAGILLIVLFGSGDDPGNDQTTQTRTSLNSLQNCKDTRRTGVEYGVTGTSINVRKGPGTNYEKIVNKKATKALGGTHYIQIDDSVTVLESCRKGDWSLIQVVKPEWLRDSHIGWVASQFLRLYGHSGILGEFIEKANKFTAELVCLKPKITPPIATISGDGQLYGCIMGQAQTAKFFINERGNSGSILSIKIIWNDWFKDAGYGLHPDRAEAEKMVRILTKIYASDLETKLVSIFFENKPTLLSSNGLTFEYRFTHGPAINERLVFVTED